MNLEIGHVGTGALARPSGPEVPGRSAVAPVGKPAPPTPVSPEARQAKSETLAGRFNPTQVTTRREGAAAKEAKDCPHRASSG